MNYSVELQEICSKIDDKKYMISLALNKTKRILIEDATFWMNNFYPKLSLKIRSLAIKSDYNADNFPKCPNCGNPVGYNKAWNDKFNVFCSDKCSKDFGRLSLEAKEKLADYAWLYDMRINRELSYKAIGEILGCSEGPIKPACRIMNVPLIRLNASTPRVQELLDDKSWLLDQYKLQGKPLHQIADEIGSSTSTLSIAIRKHDIEATPANAYPRKNKRSLQEIEMCDYIQSLVDFNLKFHENIGNTSVLYGKEIDVLLPSLGLGFEYNGMFSHYYRPEAEKAAGRKGQQYHLNKKQVAYKNGIDLIHIFSDDWIFRKEIVKSMISSKLKKNERIYARKCEIIIPKNTDKLTFMAQNHLQGKDKSSIYYALSYNNEIVAVMTFCKSRYNKKYDWELSRFATKKFTNVVGGFSKLLCHFRKNNTGSVISYADKTHSNGNVYKQNGFILLHVNPPGYAYVNFKISGEQRMHRANFMKKKIAPDDPRPEHEIMFERGYKQVFDCGTLTFVLL